MNPETLKIADDIYQAAKYTVADRRVVVIVVEDGGQFIMHSNLSAEHSIEVLSAALKGIRP